MNQFFPRIIYKQFFNLISEITPIKEASLITFGSVLQITLLKSRQIALPSGNLFAHDVFDPFPLYRRLDPAHQRSKSSSLSGFFADLDFSRNYTRIALR